MLKNYNKLFTVLILVFSFGVCDVYAQHSQPIMPEFIKKNNDKTKKQLFDFRLSTDISSASMRYDNNGKGIVDDTGIFVDSLGEEHKYQYTTDFSQQKYNLQIGYLGVKNLYCYAKLPLAYTSISEKLKYEADTDFSRRYERNKGSKLYSEGVQFDAGYTFNLDFLMSAIPNPNLNPNDFSLNVTFLGSVFLPFHAYSSASKSIDDFYGKKVELERPFEASAGIKMDCVAGKFRMQVGMIEQISKVFADRTHINFLFGLSNVENTELYANLKYVKSSGDYRDEYRVDFWRQTLWENYLDLDLGFTMFFTDEFYSNVGYTIRLWGENTLSRKTVSINLGYIIRK
jgi:hypothetical protein